MTLISEPCFMWCGSSTPRTPEYLKDKMILSPKANFGMDWCGSSTPRTPEYLKRHETKKGMREKHIGHIG